MPQRPSIHRAEAGLDQFEPAPRAKRQRKATQPAEPAEAPSSPPAKRGPGGGGGGVSRPRRAAVLEQHDMRTRRNLNPAQLDCLDTAFDSFESPSRRLAACLGQRASGDYDLDCPLSPVGRYVGCAAGKCSLHSLSHTQLFLSIPLDSPGQVAKHKHERNGRRKVAQAERSAARGVAKALTAAARNAPAGKENEAAPALVALSQQARGVTPRGGEQRTDSLPLSPRRAMPARLDAPIASIGFELLLAAVSGP